jgi:hypothetical protein
MRIVPMFAAIAFVTLCALQVSQEEYGAATWSAGWIVLTCAMAICDVIREVGRR